MFVLMASWMFPRLTLHWKHKMDFDVDEPCTEVERGIQFDLRPRDLEQPQSPSRVSFR